MEKRERRFKMLSISAGDLLGFLMAARDGNHLRLPRFNGVPKDTRYEAINYNFVTDCFEVRLWHESFPVIPDGEMIPTQWAELYGVRLELLPDDDTGVPTFIQILRQGIESMSTALSQGVFVNAPHGVDICPALLPPDCCNAVPDSFTVTVGDASATVPLRPSGVTPQQCQPADISCVSEPARPAWEPGQKAKPVERPKRYWEGNE